MRQVKLSQFRLHAAGYGCHFSNFFKPLTRVSVCIPVALNNGIAQPCHQNPNQHTIPHTENLIYWIRQAGHVTTLVQRMAWCRQATSHYLNQCWDLADITGTIKPYHVIESLQPISSLDTHFKIGCQPHRIGHEQHLNLEMDMGPYPKISKFKWIDVIEN